MNDILQLKGKFEQKARVSGPPITSLPKRTSVDSLKIESLCEDLIEMEKFWKTQKILTGGLVSVYYIKIAAKSNRLNELLSYSGNKPNDTVVGAKFSNGTKKKHIITHYVPLVAFKRAITRLKASIIILNSEFGGIITDDILNSKGSLEHIDFKKYNIAKSTFKNIIVDAYYVEKFDVENSDFNPKKSSIVTIYDTGIDTITLLSKLGIKIYNERIINDTTILLDENYLEILMQKAPYLVSMATENLSELAPSDFLESFDTQFSLIDQPSNEPTIGVIDTLFDDRVYFSEWVEFNNMVDSDIQLESEDYRHGTAVSSLIVDGPSINPLLDDGCGRFRVRHFGVATNSAFNSFSIIRTIKEIIAKNKDIHVWNLSLGSNEEVNSNFISAEAAILDQIQFDYDVIFVIAGTNKKTSDEDKRIGAPADSINSMIVNSVGFNKQPAQYSRQGVVLSFFTKPDVSYYGGTSDNYMSVCEPLGKAHVSGTSYAAPWIARKLSYLIDVIGLSKETAKALLIDSAIGWKNNSTLENLTLLGHGVVPIRIEDIINSPDDEIRFLVSGISEKYDTFNYSFPVPIHNNKYPFVAKATLCYFPKCSRNQGVDYTNTELDIYFGRITNKDKLDSINKNKQSIEDEDHYLYEEDARKTFRKWDNVKHISDNLTPRSQAKKVYDNRLWGMSIKTKERLNTNDGEGIRFSVVVTLKEINGVNRIEDFIQQCSLKGWLVNRINVENRIDIYQKAEEDITFE